LFCLLVAHIFSHQPVQGLVFGSRFPVPLSRLFFTFWRLGAPYRAATEAPPPSSPDFFLFPSLVLPASFLGFSRFLLSSLVFFFLQAIFSLDDPYCFFTASFLRFTCFSVFLPPRPDHDSVFIPPFFSIPCRFPPG